MTSNLIKTIYSKMLVLSEKEVRQCLPMADCLAINQKALMSISGAASQAGGKGIVPTRLGLVGPRPAGASGAEDWTLFKPAAFYADAAATSIMGLKVVSTRAQNPERGLPLVPATILLLDADSGMVQATLGGTYLTGARTAACSALATRLARPDLRSLVVFGAGLQAECHIVAIQTAIGRPIPQITIVDRTTTKAQALREKLGLHGRCTILLLDDRAGVETALSTADVVAAATNTDTPLFDGKALPPGCHINGIGSYTPEMQEIPANAVDRCRVLIDTPEATTVGDLKHLAANHPVTLLGDALGDPESWGPNDHDGGRYDCTFYKGVGTAIQDVMTAHMVVNRARELGIGTVVDMN